MEQGKVKVLIVEDDVVYREYMLELLANEKIVDVDLVEDSISAEKCLSAKKYNIILIDVFLKGNKTGVSLGQYIDKVYKIPFIYVTSSLDAQMLEIMKDTYPAAVISKPIDPRTFVSNVKLAIYNKRKVKKDLHILNDRIFVKKDCVFEKVYVADIIYVESDHIYNYIYVVNGDKLFIRGRLIDFYEKFPDYFTQISKKYVININFIDHFDRQTITVNNKVFKVSRKFKSSIYGRLVSF
jgi:DNA-binding LytR/AlgR family response regulator